MTVKFFVCWNGTGSSPAIIKRDMADAWEAVGIENLWPYQEIEYRGGEIINTYDTYADAKAHYDQLAKMAWHYGDEPCIGCGQPTSYESSGEHALCPTCCLEFHNPEH